MKTYHKKKLSPLALTAQKQLENNSNSPAFATLLTNPKVKEITNFNIVKNKYRLAKSLINKEEAHTFAPTLLYQLLTEYDPNQASFKTYLSRYLNFKLKKITRKSRPESAIEDLQNYSKNPDLFKAQEEIQSPKDVSEAEKYIPSSYTLLRQKRLENASFRDPEISFAERKKKMLQKDIIQKLLARIREIADPVERTFKKTWIRIVMGKEQYSSYITKHDRIKIKPSALIETATRKFRSANIDYSEFERLSQRGKYARLDRYLKQIKKTFQEVLADKDVPEWKLMLSGEDWTNELLNLR